MTVTQPPLVGETFEQPINDAEQRSEVLANLLDVSTYLVSVLNPNELFAGLVRRVVEVVPAVQAGLLWISTGTRLRCIWSRSMVSTLVRRVRLSVGCACALAKVWRVKRCGAVSRC